MIKITKHHTLLPNWLRVKNLLGSLQKLQVLAKPQTLETRVSRGLDQAWVSRPPSALGGGDM